MAMAFAPSNRRSRWGSRNPRRPLWTRSPSHTPSPSMKPESNTETTASARGFSSPLTLIRIDGFRGPDTSCMDWPMRLLRGPSVPFLVRRQRISFGRFDEPINVLGRAVDRVEAQGRGAGVAHVVPRTGRHDDREIVAHRILDAVDVDRARALLEAEELVA